MTTTRTYLGIDLSIRSTGLCRFDYFRDKLSGVYSTAVVPPEELFGIMRISWVVDQIMPMVEGAEVICLEDYAFGMAIRSSSVTGLAELRGFLYSRLWPLHWGKLRLLGPTQVKHFITGDRVVKKADIKGTQAGKLDVIRAIKRKWKLDFTSKKLVRGKPRTILRDDEADAFGLAVVAARFDEWLLGARIKIPVHEVKIFKALAKGRWEVLAENHFSAP